MKSIPSKEIHSINVPEPRHVQSDFRYNYFVPSEGTQEFDAHSQKFLRRVAASISGEFANSAESTLPRYVRVSWTMPFTRTANVDAGYISSNGAKIVTETSFSTDSFLSVQFADPLLSERMYGFVSGSIELQKESTGDMSGRQLSQMFGSSVSPVSGFNIVNEGIEQIRKRFGMSFFDSQGVEMLDSKWNDVNDVSTLVQLNSVLASDIVNKVMDDPHSPYTEELKQLSSMTRELTDYAKQSRLKGLSEDDFRTYVPYVSVKSGNIPLDASSAEVVGYVLDKVEYLPDGTSKSHPPIYIENFATMTYLDYRVRYGATYGYNVRAIARVRSVAIDADTKDIALVTFLASSRPSNRVMSRCVEFVAPPPPTDVSFVWDYEHDKLHVKWAMPVTPQRDVKGFQVFRRSTHREPFQLQKMFQFNDAVVQDDTTIHASEDYIEARSIVHAKSPVCMFVDEEFTKTSSFIYTVVSIDAHGMTSNYGPQYRISFDQFKNKLVLEHVSHSGAPKPYPNMYLSTDLFVDTIRVAGPGSKKVKLYLSPECYTMVDDKNQESDVFVTDKGSYVFQFINTDNQKLTKFEVSLKDRRTKK